MLDLVLLFAQGLYVFPKGVESQNESEIAAQNKANMPPHFPLYKSEDQTLLKSEGYLDSVFQQSVPH